MVVIKSPFVALCRLGKCFWCINLRIASTKSQNNVSIIKSHSPKFWSLLFVGTENLSFMMEAQGKAIVNYRTKMKWHYASWPHPFSARVHLTNITHFYFVWLGMHVSSVVIWSVSIDRLTIRPRIAVRYGSWTIQSPVGITRELKYTHFQAMHSILFYFCVSVVFSLFNFFYFFQYINIQMHILMGWMRR